MAQWFFNQANFASQRTPGHVQLETFWLSHLRAGMLLASSGLKLDMLLNILQCTEQDSTKDGTYVKVEKKTKCTLRQCNRGQRRSDVKDLCPRHKFSELLTVLSGLAQTALLKSPPWNSREMVHSFDSLITGNKFANGPITTLKVSSHLRGKLIM